MNAIDFKLLQSALKDFFAREFGDSAVFCSCQVSENISLFDSEIDLIKKAVPKRAYEFSAGRVCARECLSYYEVEKFELLRGEFGEPLWPDYYTGSITHHDNVAIAVVAQKKLIQYIGIDLVSVNESLENTDLITCDDELKLFENSGFNVKPEILIFSVKESVIKICSPLLQEFIDFKEIELSIDSKDQLWASLERVKPLISLKWLISGNSFFCVAILDTL